MRWPDGAEGEPLGGDLGVALFGLAVTDGVAPGLHRRVTREVRLRRSSLGQRASVGDFPVPNRVIRRLRWSELFATVAECSRGRQAGRGDR